MAGITLTKSNFENEVLHSDKPVLLDFYADWCGPCKMLSPILHEIAEENAGSVKVGKVNVDEQMAQKLAQIRGLDVEEVIRVTTENAKRLYRIP